MLLLLTLVFRYLALVCSSSDLELDHRRLELQMKGATAVFVLNRLLVLRAQNWVGMGFTLCVFVCEAACVHDCAPPHAF